MSTWPPKPSWLASRSQRTRYAVGSTSSGRRNDGGSGSGGGTTASRPGAVDVEAIAVAHDAARDADAALVFVRDRLARGDERDVCVTDREASAAQVAIPDLDARAVDRIRADLIEVRHVAPAGLDVRQRAG